MLATITTYNTHPASTEQKLSGLSNARFQPSQLARGITTYNYDEQVGITLTQDFTSLAYNVTAVAQTGPDGAGPAYLLNGLTDTGYWYQVGVSYNWPNLAGGYQPGFGMNYEVFAPPSVFTSCPSGSVFPTSCGGGLDPFYVNPGDTVLLSLNFTATGYVVMLTHDWNTASTLSREFSSEAASSFIGLPSQSAQNGFFSGLMTEQYHSNPYYGAGQPVLYTTNQYNLTSAWMWMDEFNSANNQGLFFDETSSPIAYSNGTVLEYFSSHGTAEASGPRQLVTGITPVMPPYIESGKVDNVTRGEPSTITLSFANYTQTMMKITETTLSSDFGSYEVTTGLPFLLNTTSSIFHTNITTPSDTSLGNHTLTITAAWQFFNQQTRIWIAPGPVKGNIILHVASGSNSTSPLPPPSPPPSSRPPSSGPSSSGPTTSSGSRKPGVSTAFTLSFAMIQLALTLGVLVYVALVVYSLILLARTRRGPSPSRFTPTAQMCLGCGAPVNPTLLFCPNCGRPAGATAMQA